jgi:hypothetical protein
MTVILASSVACRGPTLDFDTLMSADVGAIVLRHLGKGSAIGACGRNADTETVLWYLNITSAGPRPLCCA